MRALLVLVAALALATPAAAAPPWTDPFDVSSRDLSVWDPTLAFARTGSALATWKFADQGSHGGPTFAAVPGGTPKALSIYENFVSPPVLYGTSRAAVAVLDQNQDAPGLAVEFGRADGTFGAPKSISKSLGISNVALAGNAQGDLALGWRDANGVYVALRPHGKPFTAPQRLASDGIGSVSVAVSARREVLLAWDAHAAVKTRLKRSRGFDRANTIASTPAGSVRLCTALAGNGRAYVAWAAQAQDGAAIYETAVRPSGAQRFRTAQLLETRPAGEVLGGLDLVVDETNRATVAWGATAVKAATTDARASFGAAQAIAPGAEAAMASAADGRRMLAWTRGPEGGPLSAAVAPASGPFGAPEPVTATGPGFSYGGGPARAVAAAFDATGNWWGLVWSNLAPVGTPDGRRTTLQMSLRAG